ncbi:MAG: NADH-quinone oxidoreductase subunit H, partial [Nitrosopumilales archaeon CG_4_9_14_0_8_um_filter_34_10]
MSVIAPNFKFSEFVKSILDNAFWILLIFTLVGIPAVQIALFYIEMPVINGELLTP